MSRAKIKTETDTLHEQLKALENNYSEAKVNETKYKKLVKELGDEIKKVFIDNEMETFGKLSMTTTQKESFNEPKAIEILRDTLSEEDFNKVVKTKEYIDDDALEKLAYNTTFDTSILASCIETSEPIRTLRIKK